jgi:hypothetical protein
LASDEHIPPLVAPYAFCLGVILVIQGIDALGGRELIMALVYPFAGAGKQ